MGSTAVRTAKRLLLGREIRHMIEQAGISQARAGELIRMSQQRLGDVINGRGVISYGDVLLLAEVLGVTDPGHIQALKDLHQDNNKRGFWTTGHNRAYREEFRLMVDLERTASTLRCVGSEFVPDLLMHEQYVRALFADGGDLHDQGATAFEDVVAARLARQEALDKDPALDCHLVVSESCLHSEIGGTEVMHTQLEHLIELSRRSNILLQLIPFKGRRNSIPTPFQLIRVESSGQAGALELAYVQGPGETRYLDDKNGLAEYERAWARLAANAIDPERTRTFIRHLQRQLYR